MSRLALAFLFLCILFAKAFSQDVILYAWAGAEDDVSSDALLTLNADQNSSSYGEMISITLLGSAANEPHHVGMTNDRKWVCGGGLLSFLNGQDEIFCFDIESDPMNPELVWTVDIADLACPDEFRAFGQDRLIVTMMCSATGGSPGGIIILKPSDQSYSHFVPNPRKNDPIAYWEEVSPVTNPHGVYLNRQSNRLISSDYLLPSSAVAGPIVGRDTVRIYNLKRQKLLATLTMEGAGGIMDAVILPNEPNYGISCGNGNHIVYAYNHKRLRGRGYEINEVFNLTEIYGDLPSAGVLSTINNRMVGPYGFQYLVMFDTTNINKFVILDELDFGSDVGAHYTRINDDETAFLVCNYFLDMNDRGIVHQGGDHLINIFDFNADKTKFTKRDFAFDFNTIYDYVLRPHAALWFYPNA